MGDAAERKYRVQLDFDQQGLDELEALKKELRAGSRAETIRDALAMLQWTAEQLRNGCRILVEDTDGQVSGVVFPFLKQYSRIGGRPVTHPVALKEFLKAGGSYAADQVDEIKG